MVGLQGMPVIIIFKGGNVESTLGFQIRREVIRQMAPRYQKASISQKGVLLDEIAATPGYARQYAMWLLNHPEEMQLLPLLSHIFDLTQDLFLRYLFLLFTHASILSYK